MIPVAEALGAYIDGFVDGGGAGNEAFLGTEAAAAVGKPFEFGSPSREGSCPFGPFTAAGFSPPWFSMILRRSLSGRRRNTSDYVQQSMWKSKGAMDPLNPQPVQYRGKKSAGSVQRQKRRM